MLGQWKPCETAPFLPRRIHSFSDQTQIGSYRYRDRDISRISPGWQSCKSCSPTFGSACTIVWCALHLIRALVKSHFGKQIARWARGAWCYDHSVCEIIPLIHSFEGLSMKLELNERLENLSRQDHPANLHDIAILSVDIPSDWKKRKSTFPSPFIQRTRCPEISVKLDLRIKWHFHYIPYTPSLASYPDLKTGAQTLGIQPGTPSIPLIKLLRYYLRITTSSPVYAGAYYAKGLAINKNLITNTQKKNPKGKKSLISILYTANNRISHHHRQTSAQKNQRN